MELYLYICIKEVNMCNNHIGDKNVFCECPDVAGRLSLQLYKHGMAWS